MQDQHRRDLNPLLHRLSNLPNRTQGIAIAYSGPGDREAESPPSPSFSLLSHPTASTTSTTTIITPSPIPDPTQITQKPPLTPPTYPNPRGIHKALPNRVGSHRNHIVIPLPSTPPVFPKFGERTTPTATAAVVGQQDGVACGEQERREDRVRDQRGEGGGEAVVGSAVQGYEGRGLRRVARCRLRRDRWSGGSGRGWKVV
ncbi:hypothetical protein KC358_g45 [Hortaea werneckii]|nr:hypothetical protein KC358_g45 [Hortaea werneckii]